MADPISKSKNYCDEDVLAKLLSHVKDAIHRSKSNSNGLLHVLTDVNTPNEIEDKNSEQLFNKNENGELGISKLLLIINEFEKLQDKYKTLEKDVEAEFNKSMSEKDSVKKIEKELETLKEENNRLKEEINNFKSSQNSSQNQLSDALENTVERLGNEIKEQKQRADEAVEKLTAHDAAAKRAISVLKKEMGGKVGQIKKMYEESLSEKDAYIIKISKLEQLLDEIQDNKSTQTRKIAENQSELDNLRSILKSKDSDYVKLLAANENLEKEIGKLNKKIETHSNDVEAQEMKVKWAQNKLKSEVEAHKETKKQISQLNAKLHEAKEEGNQIRKNCQEMIERYQGDEEIASVRLNKELEEQANKLKRLEETISQQKQLMDKKEKDYQSVKQENDKLASQVFEFKTKVALFEGKNINLTKDLDERVKDCAEFKTKLETYKEQVNDIQDLKERLKRYEEEVKTLNETNTTMKQQLNECEVELAESKTKQEEILLFSQNLTENNASSKAMTTDLEYKLDILEQEKKETAIKLQRSEESYKGKIQQLLSEKNSLQSRINDLSNTVEEKSSIINELSATLDGAQDELKVIKKKNTSQMKDLQRQLHQTTRKIERLENNSKNGSIENLSVRSRTSSNASLEKPSDSPPNYSSSPHMPHEAILISQDHNIIQPNSNRNQEFQEIEIDKKVLIERICKLQRLHAKKNEKLEFMEEHINQLTEDLQKKTKIIQYYISREEAGSLVSNRFDKNKADVTQHGGIMASLYSAKPTDKGMTLELSLTINRKLQAVLEDTILKNIMLKENINTLGGEIARLQNELKEAKS